ncbi:MAG: Hsp70 family protein [Planctomycetota bacterium]
MMSAMMMRIARRRRSSKRLFSRGKSGGKSAVIGIDLGTTNSCVAVMEGGKARVMSNADGERTTPSYVSFPADGPAVVGRWAKQQSDADPTNTFYAVKRLMGRRFKDREVQDQIVSLPYRVVESPTGEAWLEDGDGKRRSPVDVSALVLAEMKRVAERHLDAGEVGAAVVTVPAYFNDAQRQATRDAGERAGLEVLRVINEPTAAALAYGLGRSDYGRMRDDDDDGGKVTAVYDLGGGTFDVSLLTIDEGVFQVKSTNGDTMLGGEDFDRVLVDHVISRLDDADHVTRVRGSEKAMQRVKEAAERAKIELSTRDSSRIELRDIVDGVDLRTTVARDEMEAMMAELAERTAPPCERALNDAEARREDVGAVVMVGGMTRMPLVQRTAAAIFGRRPLGDGEVNPDEAVAMGAAIQGGVLAGQVADLLLLDVNPLSLGIETYGGAFARLIARNTTLPARASQVATLY